MEINIEKAREQIKEAAIGEDLLDDLGIGGLTDQFKDLNLAELLENPPPGIDEAVAVSQVSYSGICPNSLSLNLGGPVSQEYRIQQV